MSNRIDEDIKNAHFAPVYLIYGEEEYLRRYNVKKLQRAILPEDDQINLTVWKEDTFDLKEFSEQAQTLPFFAEHRLLIVENSGLFKKGGADAGKILSTLPEETIVIFSEKEVDKRGKLFKQVTTGGAALECAHPNEEALTRWILNRLTREGRQIQRSAMQLFLERTGSDMNQISREIDKLIDYTRGRDAILLEDVKILTTESVETRVFTLIDEMSMRNTAKALERYHELLAEKQAPIMILIMMGRQFAKLCQVKELREQGMDQGRIAEKMGMKNGFAVRKTLGQAARYSAEELRRAFELCVRTNEDIIRGKISDVLGVETAIVETSSPEPGPALQA